MEIPDCVPADIRRELLRDMKSLSACPDALFTRVHPVTLPALSRIVSARIGRRVLDTWFLTSYGPGEMSDLHADGRVRFPDGTMSDVSMPYNAKDAMKHFFVGKDTGEPDKNDVLECCSLDILG